MRLPSWAGYGLVLMVVLGLAWPGGAAGKALVAVTQGTSGVLRSGAQVVTGGPA